ncbi:MAG: hypothetical protein RSB77_04640 [Bacilli bacterium]
MEKIIKNNKIKNIIIFLIPFIIFLIVLLAFYPGILSFDSINQWNQVQSGIINDAHPFLTTYIMFLLSKIWNSTAMICLFQIAVFSFVWSYFCNYIRKISKYSFNKQIIFTVVMCLFPIMFLYSITLWKDILYSYYLMFLSILLLIGVKKKFQYSITEILLVGFLISIATLYRHNAIIPTFLIFCFLIYYFIKEKINFKKIILLICSILSFYTILDMPEKILKKEEIKKEPEISFLTTYSIYALSTFYNYNVKFTKEEYELLHNVIPKNLWTEKYDRYLINTLLFVPELNKEYANKHASEITKLVLKYGLKYPHIGVLHYLQADSMLYNPLPLGSLYVFDFSEWRPYYGFDEKTDTKLPMVRKCLTGLVNITYNKPYILRVLLYRPIYPLALSVILMFIMIKRKWIEKRMWFMMSPMLFNTLSLLPINIAQDLRYVYINFLTLPLVLMLFLSIYKRKKITTH